jgi:nucleoid-associated protein YgaU
VSTDHPTRAEIRNTPTASAALSPRSAHHPSRTREAGHAPSTYVVNEGDCLWYIAARHLGEGASDSAIAKEVTRLWKLNAKRIGTGDPDLIYAGQTLAL